jgi:hypothetical protein
MIIRTLYLRDTLDSYTLLCLKASIGDMRLRRQGIRVPNFILRDIPLVNNSHHTAVSDAGAIGLGTTRGENQHEL